MITNHPDLAQRALNLYIDYLDRLDNQKPFDNQPVRSIGHGSYGTVFRLKIDNKEYALKIGHWRQIRPKEYKSLELMGESGVTPQPFCWYNEEISKRGILMEYLQGQELGNFVFLKNWSESETRKWINPKIERIEEKFMEKGLSLPGDLHTANVIVLPNEELKIIDLDFCARPKKNKNYELTRLNNQAFLYLSKHIKEIIELRCK